MRIKVGQDGQSWCCSRRRLPSVSKEPDVILVCFWIFYLSYVSFQPCLALSFFHWTSSSFSPLIWMSTKPHQPLQNFVSQKYSEFLTSPPFTNSIHCFFVSPSDGSLLSSTFPLPPLFRMMLCSSLHHLQELHYFLNPVFSS